MGGGDEKAKAENRFPDRKERNKLKQKREEEEKTKSTGQRESMFTTLPPKCVTEPSEGSFHRQPSSMSKTQTLTLLYLFLSEPLLSTKDLLFFLASDPVFCFCSQPSRFCPCTENGATLFTALDVVYFQERAWWLSHSK